MKPSITSKKALSGKEDPVPIMFSMAKAYQAIGQNEKSVSILQKGTSAIPER